MTDVPVSRKKPLTPEDLELVKRVAAFNVTGKSVLAISKELNISRQRVNRLMESPECQELINAANEAVKDYLIEAKRDLAKLTKKAVAAINRALDSDQVSDSLAAAKIVLKAVGLEEAEQESQDTNITIVMPSIPGSEPAVTMESTDYEIQEPESK